MMEKKKQRRPDLTHRVKELEAEIERLKEYAKQSVPHLEWAYSEDISDKKLKELIDNLNNSLSWDKTEHPYTHHSGEE